MSDRRLLYAAGFLRATAVAMTGVLLGLYLPTLGLDTAATGLVVGAGLAGGALATLLATLWVERIGRRRFLAGVALVSALGTAAAAFVSAPAALAAVAFLGMLNGMGRDRGAASVLEQALLPSTTDDRGRTGVFARYTVLQDVGSALGSLLAAAPALLVATAGLGRLDAQRAGLLLCALLLLPGFFLYRGLSPAVVPPPAPRVPLAPESRRVLARICGLFALDGIGGGFLTTALLTVFFKARFDASDGAVAGLFFGSRVLNALSHFGAAWLARRIGLVNTMVFTHIPGSLLLVTVAFAPSFPVAAVLFLLREGLVEMDVPTRSSYVMAVVRPEERTFASGATHLVRVAAWAVAPSLAGLFMKGMALGVPLFAGAGLKITYDVLLWVSFRKLKPPEER